MALINLSMILVFAVTVGICPGRAIHAQTFNGRPKRKGAAYDSTVDKTRFSANFATATALLAGATWNALGMYVEQLEPMVDQLWTNRGLIVEQLSSNWLGSF